MLTEVHTEAGTDQDSTGIVSLKEQKSEIDSLEDDEAGRIETTKKADTSPFGRQQLLLALSFGGVILLGAILRFWGVGDKPLHHDESMHAYFSWRFVLDTLDRWSACAQAQGQGVGAAGCYHYDPLLHGPFQFHIIAFTYKICQLLGVYDNGINNFTARIPAATLGTVIVGLPYFLRDRLGNIGAWLACFLLAVSPSMVYFSRFTREDIYMACFTLLLVVATARYLSTRRAYWLIIAAVAFAFSYATKEATFLTAAVFGSYLGALIMWELGIHWPIRLTIEPQVPLANYLPQNGSPIALIVYFLTLGLIGKWFFGWLKGISYYLSSDPQNLTAGNAYVQGLKDGTVRILPWLGILLGLYILFLISREWFGLFPTLGRRSLTKNVKLAQHPLLNTIVTMPWTHWFSALACAWAVFLVLFTVLFTNIRGGIGDGIWQGLYYWLQQQQVARGGQPWYYYFLLIPLYEQIGVVFGIVGLIRCIVYPTRFRLFMVYWLIGNVAIYTWAGEKMPWLMIHMTMPLLILAAIGLEPAIVRCINLAKNWWVKRGTVQPTPTVAEGEEQHVPVLAPRNRKEVIAGTGAIFAVAMAVLLLVPTIHNMYEVTYVHPADAPYEMMIYVQTTNDVHTVMAKIDALDQKLYRGQHQLKIAVMADATWPFAWYVRDYTNICFSFPNARTCPNFNADVIIAASADNLQQVQLQYGGTYAYHVYKMRAQWDQGYMMPPCVRTYDDFCTDPQPYVGVGPLLWLSYGENPPAGAKFDVGRAASNIWQWWWYRKPFGSTDGWYPMGLLIRRDLGVAP